MLPIIRGLRARGVDPLVAVPDPERARLIFGADTPRLICSVPLPLVPGPHRQFNSLADILLQGGFANVTALSTAVDGWRALYRDERIDTVLLDFAPVAQLAAWLMELRMVSASVVFAVPPIPLPAIRPVTPQSAPRLEASERELLECTNRVITRAGRAPIDTLATWLHAPKRFLYGIAQTNVFDFEPDGGYLGPIGALPAKETVDWPDSGRKRVLCYLRWTRHTPALIKSLDRADREMFCAIPQAPASWAQGLPKKRVRVYSTPVALQPLMCAADVIVSHASGGVACEGLIAGKPQLFIPFDREKMLISERLTKMKVSLTLPPSRPASQASLSVQKLLDDAEFTKAAKSISQTLRPEAWNEALELIVSGLTK